MISSRASKVVALLHEYDEFRKHLKLNEQLKSRGDELETAVCNLEKPSNRVALQREREWIKDSQLPSTEVDKLQTLIVKIRELLSTEPGEINAFVNRLVKATEKIVVVVDEQTEIVWAEILKRRQPVVEEIELKRCEQFNSESATVEEIRRLARVSVARVPTDREALYEIENRWGRLRELIGKLPKGSDNPDVIRFLDAVRKAGAPLNLLTDSVRQYLDETGKAAAFRVYQDR
jgi:hypothetical protein